MFSVTSVLTLNDFPGLPSNLQGVLNTWHSVQAGGSGLKFPLRHSFLLKEHGYPGKEREEAEKKPLWLNKSPGAGCSPRGAEGLRTSAGHLGRMPEIKVRAGSVAVNAVLCSLFL